MLQHLRPCSQSMRANETTADGSDESSEQTDSVDWETVGRDLLATEFDVAGSELNHVLSEVSRSLRNGEPLTDEQLREVSIEVEGLVSTLRVLDASPFGGRSTAGPTSTALDRLLSEADQAEEVESR